MSPTWQTGKLIVWKDDKGFGFIQSNQDTKRVFLHITDVKTTGRRPLVGDTIHYQLAADRGRKIKAINAAIVGLEPAAQPKSPLTKFWTLASWRAGKSRLPLWLEVLGLAAIPLAGALLLAPDNPLPLLLYLALGPLTFITYREDKHRAQQSKWRISEGRLHLLELTGGWIGGYAAQRTLRHKNRKGSYQLIFWLIVAGHLTGWLVWLLGKTG